MSRTRLVVVAAALFAGLFGPSARTQIPTYIVLAPSCDATGTSGNYSIQVTGEGFVQGVDPEYVTITFDTGGTPETFTRPIESNGSLSADSGRNPPITPTRRVPGTYVVEAVDGAGNSAKATFQVPCQTPTITVDPVCGPAARSGRYSIQVSGSGFGRSEFPRSVTITFDADGRSPESFGGVPLRPDGSFGPVTITPTRRTAGLYMIQATNDVTGASSKQGFTVPCAPGFRPLLRLDPPLGPPGFVTVAIGSRFPPNTAVTLDWEPGLGLLRVVSDRAGSFRVPVVVLPRDVLGPRRLVASGAGLSFVSASYLVVPGSMQPPRFTSR